jgi:hypothetical protein
MVATEQAAPVGEIEPAVAGDHQVSASLAAATRATATRASGSDGRKAADAGAKEASPPPSHAPPEPGALAGGTQSTSSSGPAATAPRQLLFVPEVTIRLSSPAVRRPAAVVLALEHPG